MSATCFTIREYKFSDRDQVIFLWRRVFKDTFINLLDAPEPSSFGVYFDQVVAVRDRIWVAAVAERRIIGFASASQAEIYNLFVESNHQRQGIGQALLRQIGQDTSASLITRTLASNTAACHFYERNGFALSHRELSPFFGEDYVVYRSNRSFGITSPEMSR